MDQAKPQKVPFHSLEEITNGFAEDRKLGSGAYGKVYMGQYKEEENKYGKNKDGKKIAVKMLYDMPGLDDEQFEKEYLNLASLQHPNIVRLVGYCYETQREYVSYNGKVVPAEGIKRALCFEYMHNGSLDSCISDESNGHDWWTRYSIIKGICKGLKYLHEELESPMYHLDLKPGNVLLDENTVPKIADFGLSRLFVEEETQMPKTSVGTQGYTPPEYIDEAVVSIKFDIFSLGVVILKIITGSQGYFRTADMTSQQFIELALENWRFRLQAISLYALESSSEQIKRCIEIALSCVEADRHKRPSIGVIVNMLNETETMIQFPDTLRNDPGSSMGQICHCICPGSDMPKTKKPISYPLDVIDSIGRVHEVTITTVCGPTGAPDSIEPIPPRIKIITIGDDLGPLVSMDAHPVEPWILVGHRSGYVSIWNYQTQARVMASHITDERGLLDYLLGKYDHCQPRIYTARFIARKQWFVAGDSDGYMHVHACMTMDKLMKIKAHSSWITSLTVHPSHPFVLSASLDQSIKLWNWETGWACIRKFRDAVSEIRNIKFSPQTESNTFASVRCNYPNWKIKIWSLFSGNPIATMECGSINNNVMNFVDYFPTGVNRLYMVTESFGSATIWDLQTKTRIAELCGLGGYECGFAVLDPQSNHPIFVTASRGNVVSLCNSTTHRYKNMVDFKLGNVRDFAYLEDVRSVAVAFPGGIGIMEIC